VRLRKARERPRTWCSDIVANKLCPVRDVTSGKGLKKIKRSINGPKQKASIQRNNEGEKRVSQR